MISRALFHSTDTRRAGDAQRDSPGPALESVPHTGVEVREHCVPLELAGIPSGPVSRGVAAALRERARREWATLDSDGCAVRGSGCVGAIPEVVLSCLVRRTFTGELDTVGEWAAGFSEELSETKEERKREKCVSDG